MAAAEGLRRLLEPRSIAVVGATDREDAYGDTILRNLERLGYEGELWGVNPARDRIRDVDCVPSLGDLPGAVDAVAVAIPAAGVPDVVAEAAAMGCGGAVVVSAGFGEVESGRELEARLTAAAAPPRSRSAGRTATASSTSRPGPASGATRSRRCRPAVSR